jgi:hypothetical protein
VRRARGGSLIARAYACPVYRFIHSPPGSIYIYIHIYIHIHVHVHIHSLGINPSRTTYCFKFPVCFENYESPQITKTTSAQNATIWMQDSCFSDLGLLLEITKIYNNWETQVDSHWGTHGINGYPWHPWASMGTHGIRGPPCNPWVPMSDTTSGGTQPQGPSAPSSSQVSTFWHDALRGHKLTRLWYIWGKHSIPYVYT